MYRFASECERFPVDARWWVWWWVWLRQRLRVRGQPKPAGTWCYLPKPQRDHFSFLCNHIEKMFLTGRASYPVERTLLTTGMLDFVLESRTKGHTRLETPQLSVTYKV